MPLSSLLGLFSSDLAIDLGTANTLVYVRGRGIAVVEPSIVAVNRITNRVEAVGVGGQAADSQAVTVNALDALPGQLAILFASLCVGYAAVAVAQRWRPAGWEPAGR